MLLHHGSEVNAGVRHQDGDGEWTGTRTHRAAGGRTSARSHQGGARRPDDPSGTWSITGQKIFITYGEHDLTDNIVHLVLACVPEAPTGTKGISCFIVPKFLVNDDGSLGDRNAVECVSIEHKMGINASPTCDGLEGATGFLIGEINQGMRYMFTMMNNARLSVGIEAWRSPIGRTSRRCSTPTARRGVRSEVRERSDHRSPDVRRMLLTMRTHIEAVRGITYLNAAAIDVARAHPDEAVRERARESADRAHADQQGLGHRRRCGDDRRRAGARRDGLHRRTGVAQHYRDARIAPIYEGTNGIQAMDLVGRKLGLRQGGVIADLVADIAATAAEAQSAGGELAALGEALAAANDTFASTIGWIQANGLGDPANALAGATPFLEMAGLVTGAWVLVRSALLAAGLDDSPGNAAFDAEFRAQKLVSAQFFVGQFLPKAVALVPSITAGPATLTAATF